MDENMKKRNERLAQTVIKGLQSRNMTGYYAEDKEAALKQALELIEENSTISMGGCMSATKLDWFRLCRRAIISTLTVLRWSLVKDCSPLMIPMSFFPVPMQ